MSSLTQKIIGSDADAYIQRVDGTSPDNTRDVVWRLIEHDLEGKVLDVGSGSGGWIKRLKASSDITQIISADIADDGASQIPGVEFHLLDASISTLPCHDDELDWIFAIEVVEHLVNPRHFIREAYRSLKPGGRLVITTPSNESIRAKISFVTRGYFPAFCDQEYYGNGHVSPILEIDLKRMAEEVEFSSISFCYKSEGLIPKMSTVWQRFFPWLEGKKWSDCLIAVLVK